MSRKQVKSDVTGKVVDIESGKPFDVYIGRPGPFAPPHKITHKARSNAVVLRRYEKWFRSQPHLMAMLSEIKGKTLGGFGDPDESHGQVILRLAGEVEGDSDVED